MAQRQEAEKSPRKMTADFIEKITLMLFAPVSMQQFVTAKDSQDKGPMWVSRTTFNKPEDQDELKSVVVKALDDLAPSKERIDDFSIKDVNVQWTSFKPLGQDKEPEAFISEQEKYDGIMKGVTTDIVALYARGGFY